MLIDPRQHLTGRWTEDVWSGLKIFVESDQKFIDLWTLDVSDLLGGKGPEGALPRRWLASMDRARALSRLSAELTSAAVGPDPLLPILGWARELTVGAAETLASGRQGDEPIEPDFTQICGHSDPNILFAMIWAVILLCQELDVNPGATLRQPLHGDLCRAALLAKELPQRIIKMGPQKVRLALKSLYRREFNQPVDEPPFTGIDAAGNLRPHGEG